MRVTRFSNDPINGLQAQINELKKQVASLSTGKIITVPNYDTVNFSFPVNAVEGQMATAPSGGDPDTPSVWFYKNGDWHEVGVGGSTGHSKIETDGAHLTTVPWNTLGFKIAIGPTQTLGTLVNMTTGGATRTDPKIKDAGVYWWHVAVDSTDTWHGGYFNLELNINGGEHVVGQFGTLNPGGSDAYAATGTVWEVAANTVFNVQILNLDSSPFPAHVFGCDLYVQKIR